MAWEWLHELGGYTITHPTDEVLYKPDNIPSYISGDYSNILTIGNNPIPDYSKTQNYRTYSHSWDVSGAGTLLLDNNCNGSQYYMYIKRSDNTNIFQSNGGAGIFSSDIMIAIDYEAQQAAPVWVTSYFANPQTANINVTSADAGIIAKREELYQIIMGLIPPLYEWSSVPAISGKNGILTLSMIKDESLGDGSPRGLQNPGDGSDIERVISASSLRVLTANMSYGQTVDLIWSGERFKATITNNSAQATLNFFLNQTTPGTWSAFYSHTFDNLTDLDGNINTYIGFIIDDDNEVAALNIINVFRNVSGTPTGTIVTFNEPGSTMSESDMHLLWGWLKGSFVDDPSPFVDNGGDGGGELVNRVNNPIPTPGLPAKSGLNTGFISEYVIEQTELNNLAKFLWSDAFVDNIKKFFNDPMEILVGLMIMPFAPKSSDLGTSRIIRGGGIETNVYGTPLVTQWTELDFGTCAIEARLKKTSDGEVEANVSSGGIYFDYSPYTEIKVYLPYCGEHSLDLNDVIGRTLSLKYSVDYLSGACVAHLTLINSDDPDAPEECHYNFSGQMGVQVPLSQADYRQRASAMIGAAVTVGSAIATIATGGLTAPMSAGAAKAAGVAKGTKAFNPANAAALGTGTASRLANNVANMHPTVQHTSGGGAVTGSLSSEYPYVMISEPNVFQAENQPHYKGYPINATYKIGDMSGYTKIENVHLDGLSCTESERAEIADMLAGGVIINKTNPSEEPDSSAPAGEFAIVFLKNKSDPETIGKHWEGSTKITGKLLYSQDINHLRVRVKGNFSAYNYAFVKAFERYYYINTFEIETGDLMIVDMESDPLQSFKDEILEVPALIDSGEDKDKARFLMNNGFWFMKQNKIIKTLTFKKSGGDAHFVRDNANETYLLTIAGDYFDTSQ